MSLSSVARPTLSLLGVVAASLGLYACLRAKPTAPSTAAAQTSVQAAPAPLPRVLVFSKTKGWVHTSIPFGIAAIQKLGKEHRFLVDTTKNAAFFTDDSLKRYAAVIFNCTTGNVLNPQQQAAFERYIQAGGGYVGIHSAADTEYEWPWYAKLMGAHFSSHPNHPNVRKATVEVTDKAHPSTAHLPDRWERTDEWYNYRSFYTGLKVLANLDENTYEGGTNGASHPIAWYHEFDGGRAWYTGGGHTDESFSQPDFLQHVLGGIQYAMGNNRPRDYSKAYSVEVPEQNRFVKTVLVNDLDSPMELAVADDGRVFYTELKGKLSVYDARTGQNKLVHKFPITSKGGTGLIGVTLDPNFSRNPFIYVYYAPPSESEPFDFYLSRFVVNPDNSLDLSSEKVLLKVPVEINSGAHHGGSLAWDKDGNLYLSTGDSSSPFPSNGYAPIDERPGREYYSLDAQRSAGNTNDLKGKILRIHPEADGTYTVPAGNLFPKGTEKTRPEIYAMGCRNPYRIAVNPKTSVVYWGEIGPDAGKDSLQGPRGYDEFNQAKKPGFFGWPYFVGNNYAYAKWDFAGNTAGPPFDPKAPVNQSPNNTGLTRLPPATPAMIWYPYAASAEFPELGLGGRSAMAGMFYSYDRASASPGKFPEYYDGGLFVFDWMRNWVMVLRFDQNENYVRSEPFMAGNGDFRRPIDLAFTRDGVMYMLEYGSVYGADNDDARLVRIEYNTGNRAPLASARVFDSTAVAQASAKAYLTSESRQNVPLVREAAGPAPLQVRFSGRGTDLDEDDRLTYEWLFDGRTVGATRPEARFTYTRPGTYPAVFRVTDAAGKVGTDTILVKVGNARPEVTITTPGNRSFFWEGKPLAYAVKVTDQETPRIDPGKVSVYLAYNPQPAASREASAGHQVLTPEPLGKSLMANSDCKACHQVDKKSVGPTFVDIARRYKTENGSLDMLARKIITGGGGNWSKQYVMSAHPQVPLPDAQEMVRYIFSLTDKQQAQKTLATEGVLTLREHKANEPRGQYTLLASYTDAGAKGAEPLTGIDLITLRPAKVSTVYADEVKGFPRWGNSLSQGSHKAHIMLRNIDLTGIRTLTYEYSAQDKDGEIEVRLDSYAGPVVSRTPFRPTGGWNKREKLTAGFDKPLSGKHDLYFVVVRRQKPFNDLINLSSIQFDE